MNDLLKSKPWFIAVGVGIGEQDTPQPTLFLYVTKLKSVDKSFVKDYHHEGFPVLVKKLGKPPAGKTTMIHQSFDGSFLMTENQLISLVMKAYKKTALIPSRGVWGYNKHYASASGALHKAFGEFPQVTNEDWLNGFDMGFEQSDGYIQGEREMLAYGTSKEFEKGFIMGHKVAEAIFNWPDSPTIYSVPEN